MPKVKISEYSATANSNTDVASINIDEGCAPSGINNAIRAVMGHLKDFQQGTYGDPFNGPVNGTLGATTASTAVVTTLTTSSTVTHNGGTANGVAYLNGSKVLTTGSALTFNGSALAVTGALSATTSITSTGSVGNVSTDSTGARLNFSRGADNYFQASSAGGYFVWIVNGSGSNAMTLDASGNLLVGTTSVISGGKISVKGATLYDGKIVIDNSSSTGGGIIELRQNNSYSGIFAVRGSVLGSTAKDLALSAGVGLGVYTYTNDGTAGPYVASGGTSWTSSSDERLKNITGEIQNGLAKVCALRAAEFTWKSDLTAQSQVGLIAQDVQAVLPQAVNKSVQNKDDPTEYLGVAYTDTIPLLVAAIKEQQALITQLTARITALESA